jgi:hypothetical protein
MSKKHLRQTLSITNSDSVKSIRQHQLWLEKTIKSQKVITLITFILIVIYYFLTTSSHSPSSLPYIYDTVPSGVSSSFHAETSFSKSESKLKKLASALQISEGELQNLSNDSSKFKTSDITVEWSPAPINQNILNPNKNTSTFMVQKNDMQFYGFSYPSYDRHDLLVSKSGEFAIVKASGNILTSWEKAQNISNCFKTENDTTSPTQCPHSEAIETDINVKNLTKNVQADYIKSHPSDVLEYKFLLKNNSPNNFTFEPRIFVGDLLEYGDIINLKDMYIDRTTGFADFKKVQIPVGNQHTVTIKLKLSSSILSTPQNLNRPNSYDCQLSVFYGVEKTTKIICPPQKVVERFLHKPYSPHFSIGLWILALLNLFLLYRNRQLLKETMVLDNHIKKGGF